MVAREPVTLTGAVRLEEAGEVGMVCRIDHQEDQPGIPRVRHATRVALTAVRVDDARIEAESPETM